MNARGAIVLSPLLAITGMALGQVNKVAMITDDADTEGGAPH